MDRWAVERAVRGSGLDPPGRLLMLTLATWCDRGTAVIPAKYTPSLRVLVAATGMARSTVADWLSRLEVAGWIVRTRPCVKDARARHTRTGYRLSIADGAHADEARPPHESEHPGCRACPPPGHGPDDLVTQAGPPGGHGSVDEAGPGGGPGDVGLVREPDPAGSGSRARPVSATRTQDITGTSNAPSGHWHVSGPGGRCRVCGAARSEHPNV